MSKARDLANAAALYAPLINPTFTKIGGDEGGEIRFAKPDTNTTLAADVTFDSYQDKLRIFESGGNVRGAYLNLAGLSNGVGSELVASPPQSGNSGKYLSTNGSVTSWSASSGMTLLSTTTLSGSSVTISSIDQTYKNLYVEIANTTNTGGNYYPSFNPNGSTNIADFVTIINQNGTFVSAVGQATQYYMNYVQRLQTNSDNYWNFTIFDYASTTKKKLFTSSGRQITMDSIKETTFSSGLWNTTSAITSINIATNQSYNAGTVLIYGVK